LTGRAALPVSARAACFHCGQPCPDQSHSRAEKLFCCHGCLVVHDLLAESGLDQFYQLSQHPGVKVGASTARDRWACLDEPALQEQLLDFTDHKQSRVTFYIPAIHCIACVWLLENLFRLHPAIGRSQVNFPRREVSVMFAAEKLKLSELVALLASLGYEPQLTLGELERPKPNLARQRQWLQVGVAGFAFGNIMLFSLPLYLGLDSWSGPFFKHLFGYISLALALPVLVYSAADYWRSAWVAVRQRLVTLDVPIAMGLAALYAQSAYEIVSGAGEGYLDSLAGLVFFLLCGRVFQQKTQDRLAFDRDYKCFFPLSARRRAADGEESVALSDLRVGDRLLLRNGELIPADARLVRGGCRIDYSFVTGESEPVRREPGEHLYAGGQQVGGTIEVEIVKPVSQSYLTSLWNHETFRKDRDDNLNTLTNRYSRRFTRIVIGVSLGAALMWTLAGDPGRGLKAFTSVLIVACPCALALAAPFALGTAQRLLGRIRAYLKNVLVLERMAQVDTIVFDKTGTLTAARARTVSFVLPSGTASDAEAMDAEIAPWVQALARQSTHPHAVRIADSLPALAAAVPVEDFVEVSGCGIAGNVQGHSVRLGSRAWLQRCGVDVPETALPAGSVSCLAVDGAFCGTFQLRNSLRPEAGAMLQQLSREYDLALLSGDTETERARFQEYFGPKARLHFNQSPLDKLGFIQQLQQAGKRVMMVGDGLNDAGALKQSDVGVAVVEKVGAFSPASDMILDASQVPKLVEILAFARKSTRIVRLSFAISALYNAAGISIAAAGILSPLICAVFMPLSSLTVVLFACGAANWAAAKGGIATESLS
jgi:Cu+-exporting ATPase